MELSDSEVEALHEILWEHFDKEYHYPDDYRESEIETYSSLRERVGDEAKRRKLWWAR